MHADPATPLRIAALEARVRALTEACEAADAVLSFLCDNDEEGIDSRALRRARRFAALQDLFDQYNKARAFAQPSIMAEHYPDQAE